MIIFREKQYLRVRLTVSYCVNNTSRMYLLLGTKTYSWIRSFDAAHGVIDSFNGVGRWNDRGFSLYSDLLHGTCEYEGKRGRGYIFEDMEG